MRISGTQMVMEALKRERVNIVFGSPDGASEQMRELLNEAKIQYVLFCHQQGAAHAADGYARTTGKPGVVFNTTGPLTTDLVTGIATAYMDSVPLVVFTGAGHSACVVNDACVDVDIYGVTMPVTKHSFVVENVNELSRCIREAFYLATTGRCGPVLIDLSLHAQLELGIFRYPNRFRIRGYSPVYNSHSGQVNKAALALTEAERPVIYAGGGVVHSGACTELKQLAEKFGIPVATTLMGLSGFPTSHPLALGMLGMHGTYWANMAVNEADLIIAAGARFDDRVTGKKTEFAKGAKIIHIDIDPAEIGKNIAVDIPIVGDVRQVLTQLLEKQGPQSTARWLAQIEEWRCCAPLQYCQDPEGEICPQFVIEQIYEQTEGKALIATEVGQHQMWTAQYYRFSKPRSFASSGGLGTMGYGFPASIGVQLGNPEELVFCVAGDGSFQMNIRELATVVAYGIPVKVAVINNQHLGLVRQWQQMFYQRRYSSVVLPGSPDFVSLAEAYGAVGLCAEKPAEVKDVLRQALAVPGPVVINFKVKAEENVFPMVPPNCPLNEMIRGFE